MKKLCSIVLPRGRMSTMVEPDVAVSIQAQMINPAKDSITFEDEDGDWFFFYKKDIVGAVIAVPQSGEAILKEVKLDGSGPLQ